MKTHEITTSKGDFILVEIPDSQRYDLSKMAIRNDFYRLLKGGSRYKREIPLVKC